MRRAFRRPPVVATAAMFVVAATVAAVFLLRKSSEPTRIAANPDSVIAFDPHSNRAVESFGVGRIPTEPASGAHAVWVYNSADKTVSRIDPHTKSVQTFSIGRAGPRIGLAVDPDSAWVSVGTVYRFDLRSTAARTLKLTRRGRAALVAVSPSEVWVIGFRPPKKLPSPGQILPFRQLGWRVDPQTNSVTRTVKLEAAVFGETSPMDAVIAGDSLWLRGQIGVARFDRHSGAFKSQLRLSDPAHANVPQWGGFAAGSGALWVADIGRGVVWRVDLKSGATVAAIPVQGQPAGIAIGGGAVWVADASGLIMKVDPRTNKVLARIPLDGIPNGLAFGFGRLWIAVD